MFKKTLTLLCCLLATLSHAQYKKPYEIYNAKGKKTDYNKMRAAAEKAEVVFFGEEHNSAIAHWLQLVLTQDLHTAKPLVLGAEMIEADNQTALNAYLADKITQEGLDTMARLWPNYPTDYKPLVDFAKAQKLPFIATNIPRRYASRVFKRDFVVLDSLPAPEKAWIAPLPIPYDAALSGYVAMVKMMDGQHNSDRFPKAQAIKDATMAHFIAQNMQPNHIFVHYNGSYHSNNKEGIVWYLQKYKPNTRVMTITTISQKDISRLDTQNLNLADFIIVVADEMTKTY